MRTSESRSILDAFGYLQYGLITSSQASESGIDTTTMTRLHQRGLIRRVRRGVYILAGVAEDSLTDIRAAWLATAPGTLADKRLEDISPIVVSHTSAASILGLGDIAPAHHTFTSLSRKQSSATDIRHRIATFSKEELIIVEGIPVTSALRTVTDLAKDRLDGDQLHLCISDAIWDHRVRASQIAIQLDAHAEFYGYSSGRALVFEALQRFPADESVTEAAQFTASS